MATSLDSLQIEIVASCQRAITAVSKLTRQLGDLSVALGNVDTKNVNSLGGALSTVSQNLSNVSSSKGVKAIKSMSEGLGQVSSQTQGLHNTAEAVRTVADEANKSSKGFQNISKNLVEMRSVSSSAQTISDNFKRLNQPLRESTVEIGRFRAIASKLKIVVPTGDLEKTYKKIKLLQEQYDALRKKIEFKSSDQYSGTYSEKAYSTDVANLEAVRNEYDRLLQKQEELSRSGGYMFNTKIFKAFSNQLGVISGRLDAVSKKITGIIKNLFHFNSASKSAKKSTDKFSLANKNLSKQLLRTAKMLRLMLVRMALREVIDEVSNGFKSLSLHSREFNSTLSTLVNGSKQLGYSFSAMVSPIIEALIPAITYLSNALINLMNIINQVFSSLTGKNTWNKAKKFTDDYAQSIQETNGSIKELKKTVLGFDELNQLQDNSNSGSGKNDAIVDMYDTEEIESKWKDLADKIKSTWDSIINPIKKAWEEMGSGVSDAWKRAFRNIKTLIKDIGKDFLEVWNQQETIDMFKNIFGIIQDIGLIVGNLAEKFDIAWKKNEVGKRILEDIRDIFAIIVQHIRNATSVTVEWSKKLDFTPLLEAFESWLTSLKPVVDAIAGVFEDFYTTVILPLTKWSIEEGLPKLIEVFTDFNKKVKWDELRQKLQTLWEHLEPFAETIGEGLILFIQDITNALADFVNGKEFENFLKSIEDWMDNVSPREVANALEGIAKAIVAVKVASVGISAIKSVIDILSKLGSAASVAKLGLEGLVVAIIAFFSYDFGNRLGKALFPDDAELYEHYRGISGFFDLLKDTGIALGELYDELWEHSAEEIQLFKTIAIVCWDHIKTSASEKINEMKNDFSTFKDNASQKLEDFKDKCSEIWNNIKGFGTGAFEKIQESASAVAGKIEGFFSNIWTGVKDGFSGAIDFIKGLWNDIADKLNGEFEFAGHEFKINLPKFSTGGFPEDGLFMANHGEMVGKFSNGKTAVANNQQITDGIAKAVYSAIMNANASSGSQSTQYINNTIQVDGETIARAVTKGQQSLNRRYSPSGAY